MLRVVREGGCGQGVCCAVVANCHRVGSKLQLELDLGGLVGHRGDLGSPVGAIAWAPYSASVFAAVTADGKVHVFDLGISKTDPICVQPVVRKGKLTHICFNADYPIIVVGDDHGCVSSLKLSPNLRKAMGGKQTKEEEIARIEKLLDSVKELDIQTGKPLAQEE